MKSKSRWSNELVPLADRLRYIFLVRAALLVGIALGTAVAPGVLGPLPAHGYAILAMWAGASVGAELVWRVWRGRGLPLFGATLMVDGLALVWLSAVGSITNVRYLIFLHLVAVVLLASYRTGLKTAMWYALLLFTVYFGGLNRAFGLAPARVGTVSRWDLGQVTIFVVTLWAAAFATACFSSVNERELRRRRFDLEALARFAVSLEGATDRHAVAATFVDALSDNFPLGRLLLVGGGRQPEVLGQRAATTDDGEPPHLSPGSALLRAQHGRQTLLLAGLDADADPWLTRVMEGASNFMIVPLHAEGGCVATLVAEHSARFGSRVERRLVTIVERFASHTALALRNAALLEQMEFMANTDGLTHIANRRTFQATLDKEVARAIRAGESLSLVMLDIDDFKLLNDTQGHQAGDDVLRQVAAALQLGSRTIDTTARYGGEEFAVILPGCGPEEALRSARRLHHFVGDQVTSVPVTVSLGVASFPEDALTAQDLVKAADDALYQAKRAGRDRVCAATSQSGGLVTQSAMASDVPAGPPVET